MSKPIVEKFTPRDVGQKSWGRELLVAHTEHYTGKLMLMRAGSRGPLQYHEQKIETMYLYSGDAQITAMNEQGQYYTIAMEAGESYHVPPGAVHQVEAVTDCVFFEASTPVFDDRVAVSRPL